MVRPLQISVVKNVWSKMPLNSSHFLGTLIFLHSEAENVIVAVTLCKALFTFKCYLPLKYLVQTDYLPSHLKLL